MMRYAGLGFMWLLVLALAVGCGSRVQVDVQATVDAAIAATVSAQGRPQATTDAAVAPTRAAPGEQLVTPTAGVPPGLTVTAPAATSASLPPRCEVVATGLNLRAGPGLVYNPPLRVLAQGTALVPLSFFSPGFPSGQWVEVQVVTDGQRGWVSAGAQFIACNLELSLLPAGSAEPTPTPAPPTATPTRVAVTLPPPPATATRVAPIAVLPVDGGGEDSPIRNARNVKGGRNVLLPGFAAREVSDPMVFRDRIVFQVEVFDSRVGLTDGAGIDSVSFTIADGFGTIVHERTERTARYCVFGGGEPTCEAWFFSEHGDRWPGGAALNPGFHSVEVVIQPKSGASVAWFWSFEVRRP